MSAQDLEQRAREYQHVLDMLGVATHEEAGAEIGRLHVAALRQQPAPVDLEQFREAVRAVDDFIFHRERCGFPHQICDCGMKEARDRLLAIIDNAGKVETAGVPTDGGIAQRGEAWLKVAQALNWYAPWWLNGEGTGREKAVAAIKKMAKAYGATQPAPVVDDAMRELIAADVEYDAARSAAKHMCTRKDTTGVDFCNAIDRVEAARSRRIAALARAQGVQS